MSFAKRMVQVTIALDKGNFTESGQNTVTLPPLRTICRINKAGGLSDSTMDVQIYGVSLSLMNQVSTLGMQISLIPKNAITVTAGEAGNLATVFVGYIMQAWSNFESMPDVPLHITAHTGLPWAVIPAPVSSFQGSRDVASIMNGFATAMGLKFENSGVSVQLSNPYYWGSTMSQMRQVAADANIEAFIDNGTLAIWPKGGARGGLIPLVSKSTGMINAPSYTPYGILLRTAFNPSISFGNKIEVKSDLLPPANGVWSVYSLDHALDAEMPGGRWESTVGAYNPAHQTPAVAPVRS